MRVGTLGTTVPPAESLLRNARRAEEKGYDSMWWPDHLMGWHPEAVWTPDVMEVAAFLPSPHIFLDTVAALAAAAVVTESMTLGTAVTEPIRRHPAMLAQELLTLDHLSAGRVVLGLGAGERENVEPYGLDYARPVARLEEALAIVRLLWEEDEPVSFDGEFWRLRDAVCGMAPYSAGEGARRYPPIWLAGHGPRTLRLVGERADGWLPVYTGLGSWSEGLRSVREAAHRAGRDPGEVTAALYAPLVIDEDEREVERLLASPFVRGLMLTLPSSAYERLGHRHPLGDDFNGFRDYVPTRLSRAEALEVFQAVPPEVCREGVLHGTPAQVLEELEAFGAAGLEHLVLWNVTLMADLSKLRPSFALQDEVMRELAATRSA